MWLQLRCFGWLSSQVVHCYYIHWSRSPIPTSCFFPSVAEREGEPGKKTECYFVKLSTIISKESSEIIQIGPNANGISIFKDFLYGQELLVHNFKLDMG